jgi:hypothetical protein
MATGPTSPRSGMIERIKAILTKPKEEWPKIDAEPASVPGLMTGWVVPLAAIGPVAGLIGSVLFGYSLLGVTYRPTIETALVGAAIGYGCAVVGVYLLALIIDALAPSFGGSKNSVQAMKLAAYAWTPAFLAGVFQIIPALGFLGLLGLYSLYLFWLGLPVLMKSPPERATSYALVTIAAAIVMYIVIGAVAAAITTAVAPRTIPTITYSP